MEPVYKAPARKKGNVVLQGTVKVKKKKEDDAEGASTDAAPETVKKAVKSETAKTHGADPTLTDPDAE